MRHLLLLLFLWLLTPARGTEAPPGRLISCAWLPDGRAVALVPASTGLELRTTRLTCPRTLEDFPDTILLFGRDGRLGPALPENALLAIAGDTLQVFFTADGKVQCAATRLPASPASDWTVAAQPLAGDLRLHLIATPARREPEVLVLQHEAGRTGSNLLRVSLRNNSVSVSDLVRAADYVAGADAYVDDQARLHIAWSEAAPEQPVHYGIFDAAGRRAGKPLVILDAGQHPTLVGRDDTDLLATEAIGSGLKVWWLTDGGVTRSEDLSGSMHFRPEFARDANGVTWLFAFDPERRAMHYRRLLGRDFTGEDIAYGVPGRWVHGFDYALTENPANSSGGFALMHHEDLPEGGAPRTRFDLLPVPRLAVADSRRVLFLDLLDVAEIDNAVQRLGVVNKFDDNPLNLNGPAGSPDEAWAGYTDVMYDEGKFRAWYTTNTNTFERNWNLAYAESGDGIHWTKPPLGLALFNGNRANNLLFPNFTDPEKPPAGSNSAVGLVTRDEQERDPARRYKMVFMSSTLEGDANVYLTWSADGVRWHLPAHRMWGKSPGPNQVVRGQTPWVEPLYSFFRDPIEPNPDYRWKLYGIDAYSGHPHFDVTASRSMGMVHGATPDALKPYPSNPVIDPRTGVDEDQNHGGSVQVYEGVYVSLYQHWSGPDWNVDLRLATSRDGLHFTRIQPDRPFLPRGQTGAWDSGMLCTPNQLILHDGRLWLFYRGSIGTLATGRALSRSNYAPAKDLLEPMRISTGLARLRQDGFTYLTVAPLRRRGGELRTNFTTDYDIKLEARVRSIPLDAAGIASRTLHANIGNLAPRFAWVKAQLRDAATGAVLPGFSFADCDAVEEDRLDHPLKWQGSSSLAAVRAGRIQVEFLLFGMLESPKLYSFWFQ